MGNPDNRIRIFKKYKEIGFIFPPIIDATAIVSKKAIVREGVFIGKGAIINTGTGLGSSVMQLVHIGENTVKEAGSVVINNLPSNCTAVGVPAKPVKKYSL